MPDYSTLSRWGVDTRWSRGSVDLSNCSGVSAVLEYCTHDCGLVQVQRLSLEDVVDCDEAPLELVERIGWCTRTAVGLELLEALERGDHQEGLGPALWRLLTALDYDELRAQPLGSPELAAQVRTRALACARRHLETCRDLVASIYRAAGDELPAGDPTGADGEVMTDLAGVDEVLAEALWGRIGQTRAVMAPPGFRDFCATRIGRVNGSLPGPSELTHIAPRRGASEAEVETAVVLYEEGENPFEWCLEVARGLER